MTLIVYLDSNDYSRFAELEKQSSAVKSVYDSLMKWGGEGRVEVRYSSVNVLEAAPLTPDAVAHGKARLAAIYGLCGRKCFKDVVRALTHEATRTEAFQVTSDVGDWNPVIYDLKIPGALETARAILDRAREVATPSQLKSYEARFFDPQGKLRSSARPQLVDFRKGIGAPEFIKYPISTQARDAYYKFLLGRVTRQDLTDALIASFADLNRWGEWYSAAWSLANGLTQRLRGPATRLADIVRRLAEMLRLFYDTLNHSGMPADEIQRRFDKRANPDAMRNLLLESIGSGMALKSREAFSWNEAPALEAYSAVAMQVVRDSAMQVVKPRKTLDSDFVDCLHICHAPFVDVFRTDAYMASAVKRCRLPIKTNFVDRLEDLPKAIASHPSFRRAE